MNKLLGYIPLRSVQVDVVPAFKVVPGGQSIGVVLQSHGVMVVGYSPISEESGKQLLPAKEAGIMLGDLIVSINGVTIESDMQAAQLIKEQGEHQKYCCWPTTWELPERDCKYQTCKR